MKVIEKAIMPNGTAIQIEDWNESYSFIPYASTIAAYPKSKVSHHGSYSPKGNETFRAEFNFDNETNARQAFEQLKTGCRTLADYAAQIHRKEYADCI